MPCDYKDYTANWKEIVKAILIRAEFRCELCGAPHKEEVLRPFHFPQKWESKLCGQFLSSGKKVKIILTVHHINANKQDNHPLNLIALCQRCHLKLDMKRHVENRKKNREK